MERLDELYLRINPMKFYYLKFILEGYDNMAILSSSTQPPHTGLVVIRHPRELAKDLFKVLASIAQHIA